MEREIKIRPTWNDEMNDESKKPKEPLQFLDIPESLKS